MSAVSGYGGGKREGLIRCNRCQLTTSGIFQYSMCVYSLTGKKLQSGPVTLKKSPLSLALSLRLLSQCIYTNCARHAHTGGVFLYASY